MIATDRQLAEQFHHDRQAHERAGDFRRRRDDLRFVDDWYLDHESWIRPAIARLGDVRGKRILDYGCGHGMAAVVLARRGARITGFDLSVGYVVEAQARALANGVAADFLQADADELPFPDVSFDAVWGSAILHHLNLKRAGRELHRVLRPGGVAVFCEPWGENPLLRLARRWLPYPGKDRTADERPLRDHDLAPLRAIFSVVEVQGFQLLGMARRLWKRESRCGGWLDRWDASLLWQFPRLKKWCRYVVLTLRR
jgi:SAM-dependent methyltransferase